MPFSEVNYSSKTPEWETPQDFFDKLDAEFHFTLDACAREHNTKCDRFYSPADNGLFQPWTGVVWCNPPYGREVGRWVAKALESSRRGATVVVLIFARTDTAWWHDYATHADEIRFVRGRLKFGGCKNSAPAPSAVLIFRPKRHSNDC